MELLIVDDEQPVLDLLAWMCAAEGRRIASTTSSLEALAYLETHHVDLLVTDVSMPGLDGLELVRRAKALQPRLLVLVVTGYSSRYSLDEVTAAGADDLLLKPFRAPDLRARLDRLAGSAQVEPISA